MQTEEALEKEFFPKLKQKLSQQFEPQRIQHHQNRRTQRNVIVRAVIKTKNWVQNTVAFIFTIAFLIPLWLFKTGLNILDYIERGIRLVVWLYVKAFILFVNFVYRILTFLKITSAVKFIQRIVKTYMGTYTSQSLNREQENINPINSIASQRQNQLIDVKKVEKRIKTPNIFIAHDENQRLTFKNHQRQEYRERINQDLVPQRTVLENIVETSPHRIKNPQLMNLPESQSHLRLKRVATEPRTLASANLQQRQLITNRQSTPPISISFRMQPDRDTSPSFYKKHAFGITDSSFKKKDSPEKQILLLHHHPITTGSQAQKQELQIQLLTLRTKMTELIDDNNNDINQLEEWIKEKSETIMMTRKENLELLEKIQSLQKQNVKKTKQFAEFQEKIREMERTLDIERNQRNGLNEQVEKLQEDIKVKTIEIMSLKEKIRTNFEHLQNMQSIFESERLEMERSPNKEEDLPYRRMNSPQVEYEMGQSLTNDLITEEKDDRLHEPLLGNRSEEEESNAKTIGDTPNEQEIEDLQGPGQTGSEKEIMEDQTSKQQNFETKSTSPIELHVEENIEDKIIEEEQRVEKVVHEGEQTLKKQEEKLIEFQHEKSTLLQKVLEKPITFKEPQLMHEQKPAEWLMEKQQDESKEDESKEEPKTQSTGRKKKNKKKKKNQ